VAFGRSWVVSHRNSARGLADGEGKEVGEYEGDMSYLRRGLVGVRSGWKGLTGVSRSSAAAACGSEVSAG
jgi:hypothetical protein